MFAEVLATYNLHRHRCFASPTSYGVKDIGNVTWTPYLLWLGKNEKRRVEKELIFNFVNYSFADYGDKPFLIAVLHEI